MSASCDKPHHVGLEPMRHLVEHLHWGCTDQAQQVWLLDAVLSEHAHELAEEQRAYASRMEGHPGFHHLAPGVLVGADHIDPEVSDG
jgi:hypothetical protein